MQDIKKQHSGQDDEYQWTAAASLLLPTDFPKHHYLVRMAESDASISAAQ